MWRYILVFLPGLAFAQVEQGPPNADFAPAFEGQTRAAQMEATQVAVEVFARGLDAPWGIAPLADGGFLVTERGGTLVRLGPGGGKVAEIAGVPPVASGGQGGLLDVAVVPSSDGGEIVYVTYAQPIGRGAALSVGRAELREDGLAQFQDIFVQSPVLRGGRHFGSRVVPGPGGVWVPTGDRGAPERAQQANGIGKVLWIPDGQDPRIWSTGHRNVQGAVLRDGALWTVEHGPRGGDELNRPEPGKNYGWPVISYGINYNGSDVGGGLAVADGYEQPVYYWDPVIAPAGMAAYPRDGAFAPWRGDLFVSSLNPGGVMRLKIENGRVVGEERLLADVGRVRDIEVLANGDLLVVLDGPGASILRVTPQG